MKKFLLLLIPMFAADQPGVVVWKASELKAKDQELAGKMSDKHVASETLANFGNHLTMAAHRDGDIAATRDAPASGSAATARLIRLRDARGLTLLIVEQSLVRENDLSKAGLAFFTVNGVISVLLGTLGIIDVVHR